MSRQSRLDEYAKPLRSENWQGAGRDQANIDRWIKRASDNSQQAERAVDKPMVLPSTKVTMRDTSMRPIEQRKIDKLMKGEEPGDKNFVGTGSYEPNVRRKA